MAVHKDAASFRRAMERAAERATEEADRIVQGTVTTAAEVAILATPVDTGRLGGNWEIVEHGDDPRDDPDGSPADALAASQIASATVKAGDYVDVANATPYAQPVDVGSATRPPKGMTRLATDAARAFLSRQRFDVE